MPPDESLQSAPLASAVPARTAPGSSVSAVRSTAGRFDPFGRQRRQAMWHHLVILFGAMAVFVVARCLQLQDATHVRLAGTSWVLPELCSVRRWLGVPCPGCGLTRSFVCLARGDLAAAWRFNPAGLLLFGLVVVQLPYRAIQLRRLAKRRRELDWDLLPWITIVVGFAMLAQWIWRIVPQVL